MADGGFCVHRGLSCTARAFVSLGPRSLFLEAWGKKVFLSEASYDRKLWQLTLKCGSDRFDDVLSCENLPWDVHVCVLLVEGPASEASCETICRGYESLTKDWRYGRRMSSMGLEMGHRQDINSCCVSSRVFTSGYLYVPISQHDIFFTKTVPSNVRNDTWIANNKASFRSPMGCLIGLVFPIPHSRTLRHGPSIVCFMPITRSTLMRTQIAMR